MAASNASFMLVIVAVFALMASAMASDAPAPSPDSGSGSIVPSFVSLFVAAVMTLLFGSALRI
ncbi:arabinogalactan protein 15 [Corchorus olitorius]|uniref:Arabinogalactan protein 15 n=1 Tax=Corchorus olitorius TaxID=93759 RepID=A0A1R3IVM3_9ROSI|nr:arabinogalactan protein 15 [Corchorus olitorius]